MYNIIITDRETGDVVADYRSCANYPVDSDLFTVWQAGDDTQHQYDPKYYDYTATRVDVGGAA